MSAPLSFKTIKNKKIMKTAMFFLLVSLTTLTSFAQREHLKFMGIPLNGSIDAFQTKLQAKGIKYDAKGSIQLKVGCRCFKGIFSGEKADFYVYYNEKSKIVYRAKAVISCINKEKGEEKFYSFRSICVIYFLGYSARYIFFFNFLYGIFNNT